MSRKPNLVRLATVLALGLAFADRPSVWAQMQTVQTPVLKLSIDPVGGGSSVELLGTPARWGLGPALGAVTFAPRTGTGDPLKLLINGALVESSVADRALTLLVAGQPGSPLAGARLKLTLTLDAGLPAIDVLAEDASEEGSPDVATGAVFPKDAFPLTVGTRGEHFVVPYLTGTLIAMD